MYPTESSVLLILLGLAAMWDLRSRRIPNLLILCGLVSALGFGIADGTLAARATGAGIGLAVLLPFFALRVLGAGDVKLMAVVGGFTGAPALLPITLYTFLAGGLLGIASVVAARSGSKILHNLRLVLFAAHARTAGAAVGTGDLGLASAARIPYAVAIAAGVLGWLLTGGWGA